MKFDLKVFYLLAFAFPSALTCQDLGQTCEVDWEINNEIKTIKFYLVCKVVEGWIGFGISTNGAMSGSDIIVFYPLQNGTILMEDLHGIGNTLPELDSKNDYHLLYSNRNNSHTTLHFSRLLNTCDEQDVEITGDTFKLIWALGPSLKLAYHQNVRGSIVVNLLEDRVVPAIEKENVLRFEQTVELNGNATLYSCKIHKSPIVTKHHITAYEIYFKSALSKKHAHHASLLSCTAPNGQSPDAFFAKYANKEFDCYYSNEYFPTEHCKFFEFQWTYGGKLTTFPEGLGFPIGEEDKYYLSMFHLDNPEKRIGVTFGVGFDLIYSKNLRDTEIGFLQLGINSSRAYSLTIPPNTDDYVSSSHCPMECTRALPEQGINVFLYLLHFHLSGRKMKIRHFRSGKELPWIAKDDNYDTNYQLSRLMKKHVNILPGDHLTVECQFETKWLNGSTVLGGRGIQEEMCQAFVMYYPRVETINRCGSGFPEEKLLSFMGIGAIKTEKAGNDPIVIAPPNLLSLRYSDVVSNVVDWTLEKREDYQKLTRFGMHRAQCNSHKEQIETRYPKISGEYLGENGQCKGRGLVLIPNMFLSVILTCKLIFGRMIVL